MPSNVWEYAQVSGGYDTNANDYTWQGNITVQPYQNGPSTAQPIQQIQQWPWPDPNLFPPAEPQAQAEEKPKKAVPDPMEPTKRLMRRRDG